MAQTKEGAIKIAAKKAGVTLDQYLKNISYGLKKCTICKQWMDIKSFSNDKSRKDGKSSRCRDCSRVIWRLKSMTSNKRKDRRDGDCNQARKRVNSDVEMGLRPDPNDLYCVICGHKGKDRRHEYHHHQGYSAYHHYDVIPLCSKCHHKEHPKCKQI